MNNPSNAPSGRTAAMRRHVATFLYTWAKHFWYAALAPAAATLVLALIPVVQILALIPAYYLFFFPAWIVGQPHFSAEYLVPLTIHGVVATAAFWLAVTALSAAIRLALSGRLGSKSN